MTKDIVVFSMIDQRVDVGIMREARLSPAEVRIVVNANRYIASSFRGRGRYDKVECHSVEDAFFAAGSLYDGDRPVMIYVVDHNGSQAMIGTWEE